MLEAETDGLGMVAAEFPTGVKPILTLTNRVATKNYAVDLSRPVSCRRRIARSWNIFAGRPSCCRPAAS
jgi:hypothetical protein